jgi:hypothetical protein
MKRVKILSAAEVGGLTGAVIVVCGRIVVVVSGGVGHSSVCEGVLGVCVPIFV